MRKMEYLKKIFPRRRRRLSALVSLFVCSLIFPTYRLSLKLYEKSRHLYQYNNDQVPHYELPLTCKPQYTAAIQRRIPDLSHHMQLEEFLKGEPIKRLRDHKDSQESMIHYTNDNDPSLVVAACEWYENSGMHHLPHEMQLLYRCFSWWNHHLQEHKRRQQAQNENSNTNSTLQLVLIRPLLDNETSILTTCARKLKYFFRRGYFPPDEEPLSPFVEGFLTALQQEPYNLQIRTKATITYSNKEQWMKKNVVRKGDSTTYGGYAYRMKYLEDAQSLAQHVSQVVYNLTTPSRCNCSSANNSSNILNNNSIDELSCRLPRVGILNRDPELYKRSLLNANDVATELYRSANQIGIDPNVSIQYFGNDISFRDQVAFFSDTDIIIAPHGGQLTGIPFMTIAAPFGKRSCSAVLEIFPKHYHWDEFFGSLADVSGISYYSMYLSDGDPKEEFPGTGLVGVPRTAKEKEIGQIAKNVQLCPSTSKIVQAIQQVTMEWQKCWNEMSCS